MRLIRLEKQKKKNKDINENTYRLVLEGRQSNDSLELMELY
jgi:hypothetical protein